MRSVDNPFPMREIVFDTETTGFDHAGADRLVEIGCIELVNRVETGQTFHRYICPDRVMPAEAMRVHGLTDAFLSDKPRFALIAAELVDFLGDAPLIAHNADFDFGFLNAELGRAGHPPVCHMTRKIDTLAIAKKRHPGAKLSLDALCSRYGVDRSQRVLHGALLDAQLLAQVYVELMGGRQIGLTLVAEPIVADEAPVVAATAPVIGVVARPARRFSASAAELAAHAAFLDDIKQPIWLR